MPARVTDDFLEFVILFENNIHFDNFGVSYLKHI